MPDRRALIFKNISAVVSTNAAGENVAQVKEGCLDRWMKEVKKLEIAVECDGSIIKTLTGPNGVFHFAMKVPVGSKEIAGIFRYENHGKALEFPWHRSLTTALPNPTSAQAPPAVAPNPPATSPAPGPVLAQSIVPQPVPGSPLVVNNITVTCCGQKPSVSTSGTENVAAETAKPKKGVADPAPPTTGKEPASDPAQDSKSTTKTTDTAGSPKLNPTSSDGEKKASSDQPTENTAAVNKTKCKRDWKKTFYVSSGTAVVVALAVLCIIVYLKLFGNKINSDQPATRITSAVPQSTDGTKDTMYITGPGAPGWTLGPKQTLGHWVDVSPEVKNGPKLTYSFYSDGGGFTVTFKNHPPVVINEATRGTPVPPNPGPFKITAHNKQVTVHILVSEIKQS